jgi:catechol 2,3-dioxygenase-like lactoylglutathione lyase family enzyme
MALHRLTTLTIGVPDVAATAAFYRDFGLAETAPGVLATRDGGEQLRLVSAPRRRLVAVGVGADDADDVARVAASLAALDVAAAREGDGLTTRDPATGVGVVVTVAPRVRETPAAADPVNAPGRVARVNRAAPAVLRSEPVRPSKLSHLAMSSPDHEATIRFFTDGVGFRTSDRFPMIAFLRCSDDHHNLAVQLGPGAFLHHTAWEVADVDEVGRGAAALLRDDPTRHVWGLGRHAVGSNFFWYLRDPAGNYAEYISDLDRITDADAYVSPAWTPMQALSAWSPPVPPEFLNPPDLAELAGREA